MRVSSWSLSAVFCAKNSFLNQRKRYTTNAYWHADPFSRRSPFPPMQVAPRRCGLYCCVVRAGFRQLCKEALGCTRCLSINKASEFPVSSQPERTNPLILEKFNLKGKTALVTGSSRGLGAASRGIGQAGAKVAVHGSRIRQRRRSSECQNRHGMPCTGRGCGRSPSARSCGRDR